jgi:nucleotide-binding universal stress UspA family protein
MVGKVDGWPARLLVAIDESQTADRAVSLSLGLASRHGSELVFATAVNHAAIVAECAVPQGALDPTPILDALDDAARAVLAAVRERARAAGCAATCALLDGAPAEAILRHAEVCGAGAIVVGSQGKGALKRFFLGSTAEGVLRGARVPVIVVPPGDADVSRAFRSITVALDRSDPAAHAAAFARSLARAEGAELTYCCVIGKPEERAAARAALERAIAPKAPPGPAAREFIVEGEPVAEILRVAESERADAIVAGYHAGHAVAHRFLGSVAAGILRRADRPVVVVPH